MSDGGFQRLILIQAAFPFPPMVGQFGADEQFREALREIFNADSPPR